jgi:hypothetical protein
LCGNEAPLSIPARNSQGRLENGNMTGSQANPDALIRIAFSGRTTPRTAGNMAKVFFKILSGLLILGFSFLLGIAVRNRDSPSTFITFTNKSQNPVTFSYRRNLADKGFDEMNRVVNGKEQVTFRVYADTASLLAFSVLDGARTMIAGYDDWSTNASLSDVLFIRRIAVEYTQSDLIIEDGGR